MSLVQVNKHWTMLVMYFTVLKLSKTYRFREKFVDIRSLEPNYIFFSGKSALIGWFFGLQRLKVQSSKWVDRITPRSGISNAKDIAGCQRERNDFQVSPLVNIFSSIIDIMNINIHCLWAQCTRGATDVMT